MLVCVCVCVCAGMISFPVHLNDRDVTIGRAIYRCDVMAELFL